MLIITQKEYDELYEKIKADVIRDMKQSKENIPYKAEYKKLTDDIEDKLYSYTTHKHSIYPLKSAVYVLTKLVLQIDRFEELKRIGVTDAAHFLRELFHLIEKHYFKVGKKL